MLNERFRLALATSFLFTSTLTKGGRTMKSKSIRTATPARIYMANAPVRMDHR